MKHFFEGFEYTIQLGVIEGTSKRKAKSKEEKEQEERGITNAKLMYILENGSPLRKIPPRPVLQMTVDYVNQNLFNQILDEGINAYLKNGQTGLEVSIKQYCNRIATYAQAIIYSNDGRLKANAPSTLRYKRKVWSKGKSKEEIKALPLMDFNHPLFMNGQLARSITCVLVNQKGEKV